ncbi:transcriptional regulator, TetR family protein [marine actinobacterium PHSC20C1]|nr:transcriptional regulator, TetR family protein [marine actinobacterium PHSC20C1]
MIAVDNEPPRRGRPPRADPAEIGMIALHLFVERGLDNVTMEDVAVAAGISRRTLFRVFPTKASIVWGGMTEFTRELEQRVNAASGNNAVAILHRAWVEALHMLDSTVEITRLRMVLIASSEDVRGWGYAQLAEANEVLERQVARIEGTAEGTLRARLISTALVAAGFSALAWWAQTNDPRTPAEVIDQSFNELDSIFGPSG